MADAVRLSAEDFQRTYEQSFRTWSAIHHTAIQEVEPGLPLPYLDLQTTFRQHASFPRNLCLAHVKYAKHNQVYATGHSVWESNQPSCEYGLSTFHQDMRIGVALRNPIPVSILAAPSAEREICWASWFARGDQSYLAVLMLAWAYILSARWAEIMPEGASLAYTGTTADHDTAPEAQTDLPPDHVDLAVDMEDAGPDEARWWAAVLSPGQGWQATMVSGQDTFFAP